MAPARRCAFAVLRRVFEQGAYADRALHAEAAALDRRERALAKRLAYGAVQRRGTLDHLIAELSGRAVARLDAPVLAALRLGVYGLVYLDGGADHATVGEAVELAKQARGGGQGAVRGGGHGLVNAVLRRAAREGRELLTALGDRTAAEAAIAHSHPRWLAEMWFEELGPATARALMARDNEPAELALRANALTGNTAAALADELPVPARTLAAWPDAVVVEGAFDAQGSPLWQAGAFMPQSRASMLVAPALRARGGERLLDLCSAPGGKTTHLAALMGARGSILAVERHPGRAQALERTCARMRAANVTVETADARAARAESFDHVLADPPCSGLGTLQSRPDLRWRVTPETLAEMVGQQQAILEAAAAAVRKGGTLVYSTCTVSQAENERQIDCFLDAHPHFTLDDLARDLPGLAHPAAPRCVLTLPHRERTAGFFIARLRREAGRAGGDRRRAAAAGESR